MEQPQPATVRLQPEARLRLHLTDGPLAAGARVRLRYLDEATPFSDRRAHMDRTLAWRRLPAGRRQVSVEVGGAWSENAIVLGRAEVALRAGETTDLEIAIAPPPAPLLQAPLTGTLALAPEHGDGAAAFLLLVPETQLDERGVRQVKIPLASMEQTASHTWHFRHQGTAIGRYLAHVMSDRSPFATTCLRTAITVDARGTPVTIACRDPIDLEIEARDAETGELLAIDSVYAYPTTEVKTSGLVRRLAYRPRDRGSVRVLSPRGALRISVDCRDGRSASVTHTVTDTDRAVTVSVHRPCGARVEIAQGDRVLTWDEDWELNFVDWENGASIGGQDVRLKRPGKARIQFTGRGWRQTCRGEFEAGPGEIGTLRIQVEPIEAR